jgi:hypothetical protein
MPLADFDPEAPEFQLTNPEVQNKFKAASDVLNRRFNFTPRREASQTHIFAFR